MNGLLPVDKPKGITSYDVIRRLKALLSAENGERRTENEKSRNPIRQSADGSPAYHAHRQAGRTGRRTPKLGHAGTLDPLATGLLIILIGKYTKRANEFLLLNKTYKAEITLGATSATDDAEGRLTPVASSEQQVAREEINNVLKRFVGEILQTPPAFSAKKVAGRRAYKQARAGKPVNLSAQKVTIYELRLEAYHYPKLKLFAKVSSGTYIRALARDIGKTLGTGAYLSSLRRTAIDEFSLKEAVKLENLSTKLIKENLKNASVRE